MTLQEIALVTDIDWKAVAVTLRDLHAAGLVVRRPYDGMTLWRRETV